MKKIFIIWVLLVSILLAGCGVAPTRDPLVIQQGTALAAIQTQLATSQFTPTPTPFATPVILSPMATATSTPIASDGIQPTVQGWSRVGFEDLPEPAGYPGWTRTIGDDRVPGRLAPFDLTLVQGQVALFQGVYFDASPVEGPSISQCYVVLVVGPVNWVKGELKIGISAADWHQTKEGFDPLLWISQKATDVSAAYKAKDLNCTLEKIQIWVYQP